MFVVWATAAAALSDSEFPNATDYQLLTSFVSHAVTFPLSCECDFHIVENHPIV